MGTAEQRVVQEHQPNIDRHALAIGQLAQDVALLQHPVRDRLDRAIASRIRMEIDRAVLGEIDLARSSMRPEEFPGMIAAGHGHRVETEFQKLIGGFADTFFGEIPGIGIDGLIAHEVDLSG